MEVVTFYDGRQTPMISVNKNIPTLDVHGSITIAAANRSVYSMDANIKGKEYCDGSKQSTKWLVHPSD